MKRWLAIAFLLCLIPSLSSAIGWFNISRAEYLKLDNGYYRMRVEVSYGGDNFYSFANLGHSYTGNFNAFYFDPRIGDEITNTTLSASQGDFVNRPGFWCEGGPQYSFNSYDFGYDFYMDRPILEPFALNYYAVFTSDPIYSTTGTPLIQTQNFAGTVIASEVPEPTSLLLVAMGLTGIGAIRYLRK